MAVTSKLYRFNCVLLVMAMIIWQLSECRSFAANGDIPGTDCLISPPIPGLPCKQYNLNSMVFYTDYDDCSDRNLKREFPHLFDVIPGKVSWPGTVINSSVGCSVSWRSGNDGSVNFLKGFLLNIEGVDMNTNGIVQCIVIDISNRTDEHTLALSHSRFSADLQHTGHFNVTIRSLPLGGNIDSISSTTVYTKEEYHPSSSASVKSSWLGHSLYVEVAFQPELKNIRNFYLSVYDNYEQQIQNLSRTVSQNFTIDYLQDGEYMLQLLPFNDSDDCLCYTTVCGDDNSVTCVPCTPYTTTISKTSKTPSYLLLGR